ncbi:hypothetical protein N1851_033180 [Merluccius polli]|uniref:Endonuclease/exonuclease/phosphatase domain-containing protein n=1 Tax=Merluccius polli TaxID=89951 RepID=A0AA47M1R4_MERPO|nr:hypothetical protein N1851_033180 [Merluccius polli]
MESHEASLLSVVEDFSLPPSPTSADFDDESDRDERKDKPGSFFWSRDGDDGTVTSSFSQSSGSLVYTATQRRRCQIFPLWDPFSKNIVSGHPKRRCHVDERAKRYNILSFSPKNLPVCMGPQSDSGQLFVAVFLCFSLHISVHLRPHYAAIFFSLVWTLLVSWDDELKRRWRGCRAGVKRSSEKRKFKPYIPAVITGNVRSLANKVDELEALTRTQREYRESSILCFTETWLHEQIPDSYVTVPGFQTVRANKDTTTTGKKKGGGLAVLVNNRWCNPGHVSVKGRVCSADIELVAVGLRPFYLPREFSSVIAITVYIPPSGKAEAACDVIHTVTAALKTKHPSAFIIITGDFNHVSLSSTLHTFYQFVTCTTRDNKTLDLLYANALPPLGRSDHNLVRLSPSYKPLVQQHPVTVRTVRKWSPEAMETLRGALEATDWDALYEPHREDIDGITDCVFEYIGFCIDNAIPTKKGHCYPNNKPWVTSDLKALLNQKKRAFRSGDRAELKQVQRELKRSIRESKDV